MREGGRGDSEGRGAEGTEREGGQRGQRGKGKKAERGVNIRTFNRSQRSPLPWLR